MGLEHLFQCSGDSDHIMVGEMLYLSFILNFNFFTVWDMLMLSN